MPFVKYSNQQKAEAVALAAIVGAEMAADQLGMTSGAIRGWAKRANRSVADTIEPTSWERLGALALAKAERMVVSGKLSAIQHATLAAIAQRNAAKVRAIAPDASLEARGAFLDWLVDAIAHEVTDAAVEALDAALSRIPRFLLVRANAEPGQPRRSALLAWFAENPETEAGDVLDWAKDAVGAILAEHGSLLAWHERELARDARERVIEARAAVLRASGMRWHEARAFAVEISADLEVAA